MSQGACDRCFQCWRSVACVLLLPGSAALFPWSRQDSVFERDLWSLQEAETILEEIESEFSLQQDEHERSRRLSGSGGEVERRHGLSPKPWFQEMSERYGAPLQQHPQRYFEVRGRRMTFAAMNESNTAPIRFHLNFDTLYEDKVQAEPFTKDRYCFREGDWFRVGHPEEAKPTGSGPDDCGDRATSYPTGNKWCICTTNDLTTDQMRAFAIEATTEAMKDMPKFIRVKPVEGVLKMRSWEGSYPGMWRKTRQTGVCCDPDCQKGLHVVVPESYCSEGLPETDVVLSVSMPPPVPGVGGAGTFCSADQYGRPLHLVFQWHRRVTASQFSQFSTQELAKHWRGLVLHEAIHGLGFGSSLWRNSFHHNGQRRQLIEQLEVTDTDGTKDFIYHFKRYTRTYEVAKAYFGCEEDDAWQGLPLMSWPVSGRDTHHETRILRDDVMSYGNGLEAVSAITLAALEDIGFYLANYSNAECMWWGRGRGCAFVMQRCSARPTGQVVNGSQAADHCDRTWTEDYGPGNREALLKCVLPNCQSRVVNGHTVCDAECFTGTDDSISCNKVAKLGAPTSAGLASWAEEMANSLLEYDFTVDTLMHLAEVALAPICLLSLIFVAKCLFCPKKKMSRILFYIFSAVSVFPGLVIFVIGGYVAFNWTEMKVFFSTQFIIGFQSLGLAVVLFTGFGVYAVYFGDRLKMTCFCLLQALELVALLAFVGLTMKFAMDLESITADALSQAGVTPQASSTAMNPTDLAAAVADSVMNEMTSLACRTYQVCCENTELLDMRVANGAPRQCQVAHAGMEADAAFILSDPSHPEFCPSVSGVNSKTAFPPFVCAWVDSASATFDMVQCRKDYCGSGLQGLETFLSAWVRLYRDNMQIFGMAFGLFFSIQLVQLIHVICIRKQTPRRRQVVPGGPSDLYDGDLQQVVPRPTKVRAAPKGSTKVNTVVVREKGGSKVAAKKSERRISVGSDLAYSGTYTGPSAAGRAKRGPG